METPPRHRVLNAAESIIGSALAGDTDDPELALLTRIHRARERQAAIEQRARAQWQRVRMNPFFPMIVAYVVMIILSYVLPILLRQFGKRATSSRVRLRSR